MFQRKLCKAPFCSPLNILHVLLLRVDQVEQTWRNVGRIEWNGSVAQLSDNSNSTMILLFLLYRPLWMTSKRTCGIIKKTENPVNLSSLMLDNRVVVQTAFILFYEQFYLKMSILFNFFTLSKRICEIFKYMRDYRVKWAKSHLEMPYLYQTIFFRFPKISYFSQIFLILWKYVSPISTSNIPWPIK